MWCAPHTTETCSDAALRRARDQLYLREEEARLYAVQKVPAAGLRTSQKIKEVAQKKQQEDSAIPVPDGHVARSLLSECVDRLRHHWPKAMQLACTSTQPHALRRRASTHAKGDCVRVRGLSRSEKRSIGNCRAPWYARASLACAIIRGLS